MHLSSLRFHSVSFLGFALPQCCLLDFLWLRYSSCSKKCSQISYSDEEFRVLTWTFSLPLSAIARTFYRKQFSPDTCWWFSFSTRWSSERFIKDRTTSFWNRTFTSSKPRPSAKSSHMISSSLLWKELKICIRDLDQRKKGSIAVLGEIFVLINSFNCRIIIIPLAKEKLFIEKLKVDPSLHAVYGKSLDIAFYMNQISNTSKVNICKEVFLTIPVVVYARQDCYLLGALNKHIDNLKASGLIDSWAAQDIRKNHEIKPETSQPKVLQLYDFKGSFYILTIGWLLGFAAFVSEHVTKMFFRKLCSRWGFCVQENPSNLIIRCS